jgi:hypothetical protein
MTSPNPREQSAVISASNCEAKLHGFRRTADGVVVSFVLHPQEVPQALALDPLGTRYMLAFAQIGDDEHPVSPAGTHQPQQERVFDEPDGSTVPNQKPSTPAGGVKSKEERAVIRAAILCSEPRFRIWMAGEDISTNEAAAMLREACGVASRGDIAKDPAALDKFLKLETDYLLEIGAMAAHR